MDNQYEVDQLQEQQGIDQENQNPDIQDDSIDSDMSIDHEQPNEEMVFVSVDGDNLGRQVGGAILSDDVQKLHEVSQSINHGQNLLMDWAENNGGQVISAGGDEGIFQVPSSALDSIEELRNQYHQIVGSTLTVGIGLKPSEAGKALLYGKLNGKDQVSQFHPEMDDFLMEAHHHAESGSGSEEEQKQDEAYLSDMYSDAQNEDISEVEHGGDNNSEDYFDETSGDDDLSENNMGVAAQALDEGGIQEGSDEDSEPIEDAMKDEASQRGVEFSLKQKLGEVLESFKSDKSMLEQMGNENPEAYSEVVQLLQQMINVAKILSSTPNTPQDVTSASIDQQSNLADPSVGKQVP